MSELLSRVTKGLVTLSMLSMLTACGATQEVVDGLPRVNVPDSAPSRLLYVTDKGEAIIVYGDKADGVLKKGWQPVEELHGKSFINDLRWMKNYGSE